MRSLEAQLEDAKEAYKIMERIAKSAMSRLHLAEMQLDTIEKENRCLIQSLRRLRAMHLHSDQYGNQIFSPESLGEINIALAREGREDRKGE